MYLITGAIGFIGFHISIKLLEQGHKVIGIDNLNHYYDVKLKKKRLNLLKNYQNFSFFKCDLKKYKNITSLKNRKKIKFIIHLAGQAGVRYSIKSPDTYINDNILAFINLLENFKSSKNLRCIFYASSSSVYGKNQNISNNVKLRPISIYAVSKLTMELIAGVYYHLYKIKSFGLRFFTVYGPYGRPDMAYYKFTNLIRKNKTIEIYNKGNHKRSFSHIDDVVENLMKTIKFYKKININKNPVLNLGNPVTIKLKKFISILEQKLNKKAKRKYISLQAGDVIETKAIVNFEKKSLNYKFKIHLEKGLERFISWHKKYHKYK